MKNINKLVLAAALFAPLFALKAQTLLTDFSTSANLGTTGVLLGSGATTTVSSGVANYTSSTPGASNFVYTPYTGVVGSYTSNWSVRIDVNYAAPAGIFTSGVPQFINLGLMVAKTGVTPGIVSDLPNFNAFGVSSNLYWNDSNVGSRDIRVGVFGVGTTTDDASRYAQATNITGTTANAILISYNATNNILRASFDADGATGGYAFTPINSLTSNASTWAMTGADTFTIYLSGNSGYDGVATGVGPTITLGQATWDNLTGGTGPGLTAIPEPSTYAAIFGAAALIVAMAVRRRSKA